ncbi:MAG TPA: hypothetical protein VNS31_10045 [Ramlibacter sp.]|nr:hypothetical protein [Ramlibacter sp.]
MELQTARQIIDTLAQGIHPVTGEAMPEDSPYNAPPVIRALFAVSQALQSQPVHQRREHPSNAGKAWRNDEDTKLASAFDAGTELKQLAADLGRTPFAVETRLIKLGKLPVRVGRFGAPAA